MIRDEKNENYSAQVSGPNHAENYYLENESINKTPLDNEFFDVVIVGAGWAGLAAARHLLSKNIQNFMILEGRDYIGGRSRTITLNDGITPAELGSQWVRGETNEHLAYQAVQISGVDYKPCEDSSEVYASSPSSSSPSSPARKVPPKKIDEIVQKFYYGPNGFLKYQERCQSEVDCDKSLRTVLDQYYAKVKPTKQEQLTIEWLVDTYVSQEYAADLADLSLWWWDNDEEIVGDDNYVAQKVGGGYSGVIEKYYAAPFKENNIRLSCKVHSIDYSNVPVVIQFLQQHQEDYNTRKTKQIQAKHVILTVPLGVLKAETIHFIPHLPETKCQAIHRLGYALLNKVILLWDEADRDKLPWPKDKEWIEKIPTSKEKGQQGQWTEFFSAMPLNGRPLLYAFVYGAFAKRVETLSDESIKSDCLKSLQNIFFDVNSDNCGGRRLPDPKQIVISRWGHDEFSYGSYSYHHIDSSPKHREILKAPLQQRLFFAGEATSVKHFATVQGAIESGIDAARLVAAKFPTGSDGKYKLWETMKHHRPPLSDRFLDTNKIK